MYILPLPGYTVCRTYIKMKSQFKSWTTVNICMHNYRISNPSRCVVVRLPLSSGSIQDMERPSLSLSWNRLVSSNLKQIKKKTTQKSFQWPHLPLGLQHSRAFHPGTEAKGVAIMRLMMCYIAGSNRNRHFIAEVCSFKQISCTE